MIVIDILIFLLFYILAVLQNSFFVHFNLFGSVPNLVFILFFLLVFFEKNQNFSRIAFYSIGAGIFLDLFSYTYFGVSILLLLLIGFLVKKAQSLLRETAGDHFPFIYFLPLFLGGIIIYHFLFMIVLARFNIGQALSGFTMDSVADIFYNAVIASLAYFMYKKFAQSGIDDRQLKLFKR